MSVVEGLRFVCQGCSYCCGVEPGFVFLSKEDIKALSEHLSISQEEFLAKYTKLASLNNKTAFSLQETENYDCVFLKEGRCSVYKARPTQCRTYPFWSSILKSKETWFNEAKFCPGIGKGPIIDSAEVEKKLEEERDNEIVLLDL